MIDTQRLRTALAAGDGAQQVGTGIITAVAKASAPWVVTVRLADGSTLDMLAAGWYEPTVNDVVLVWRAGDTAVCLGGFAGSSKTIATTATLTSIAAPATPPAPPTQPPTVRVAYVSAISSRSWRDGAWRADDEVHQGGDVAERGFWFYGGQIAGAKGSGTITAATIWVPRSAALHGADRGNVRLGTHTFTSLPGSGASALSNVNSFTAAVGRGGDVALQLTAAQLAALNAGAAGLGLEPGAVGARDADCLIVAGVSTQPATGQLALTISG